MTEKKSMIMCLDGVMAELVKRQPLDVVVSGSSPFLSRMLRVRLWVVMLLLASDVSAWHPKVFISTLPGRKNSSSEQRVICVVH